jgi:bilirubin oxidase
MTRGREAVVRFTNSASRPASIHLHGSYSRAPWDGWAEDVTNPGQFKDYYYPNHQPQRTLWYHDHAIGITAVNAYFGQAGKSSLPIADFHHADRTRVLYPYRQQRANHSTNW